MANTMILPLQISRQYGASLDADYAFPSLEKLKEYVQSALSYSGQILYCVENDTLYKVNKDKTNITSLDSSQGGGTGSNTREITQAEYDLLSPDEQNNGTIYFISDAVGGIVTVDNGLDKTSDNPISNKVVSTKFEEIEDMISNGGVPGNTSETEVIFVDATFTPTDATNASVTIDGYDFSTLWGLIDEGKEVVLKATISDEKLLFRVDSYRSEMIRFVSSIVEETSITEYAIFMSYLGIMGKINVVSNSFTVDDVPTRDSQAIVRSGGVFTELEKKQNKVVGTDNQYAVFNAQGELVGENKPVIDTTPTLDSTNAVQSGGVKTEIDRIYNKLESNTNKSIMCKIETQETSSTEMTVTITDGNGFDSLKTAIDNCCCVMLYDVTKWNVYHLSSFNENIMDFTSNYNGKTYTIKISTIMGRESVFGTIS